MKVWVLAGVLGRPGAFQLGSLGVGELQFGVLGWLGITKLGPLGASGLPVESLKLWKSS